MQKNNYIFDFTIEPRIGDEISVVFSSDNNYIPYLGVAIKSLIENSSFEKKYTIYILTEDLKENIKKKLLSLETSNVKINCIDVAPIFNTLKNTNFYTPGHFTKAVYYRFFIPNIFFKFKKIIYCDCDAIFLDDVAELYNIGIGNSLLGVVKDTVVNCGLSMGYHIEYLQQILKLKEPQNYFNSGICIFNIPSCLEFNLSKKCIEKLEEIKEPKFVDQCVLNAVCENKIYFLDIKWNVQNHAIMEFYNLNEVLTAEQHNEYIDALKNPKFLHYTSHIKPWKCPSSYNANLFWHYAKKTPFFYNIIFKNIKDIIALPKEPFLYANKLQVVFSIRKAKTPTKIYKILTILGLKIIISIKERKI